MPRRKPSSRLRKLNFRPRRRLLKRLNRSKSVLDLLRRLKNKPGRRHRDRLKKKLRRLLKLSLNNKPNRSLRSKRRRDSKKRKNRRSKPRNWSKKKKRRLPLPLFQPLLLLRLSLPK